MERDEYARLRLSLKKIKEEVSFIESINYVPSLIEAFDIIEIERIERDLKI